MTTVHLPPARPNADVEHGEVPQSGVRSGDRLRRLEQRRRLAREEIVTVLFLLVALAATVAVLAMQWLET